ncbi:hypothetical protein PPERSA_03877 [Pseudocohnilembus persalinus]|uniref:Uncharacterized protein n=1 Tax=Pseudocohnilembus persalinus TaxID=266149 RepID=A0A0V0Q982_PSEPJ|nr:hypothetical protein PPERSA_03877 [Pseudocohnilembus persalinus]|eukprot:KRW98742.1 hypothetical protein PPERSA_03877 [Pseudocohnilembus persalinus]
MLKDLEKKLQPEYQKVSESFKEIDEEQKRLGQEVATQIQEELKEFQLEVERKNKSSYEIAKEHHTISQQLQELEKKKEIQQKLFEAQKQKGELEALQTDKQLDLQLENIKKQTEMFPGGGEQEIAQLTENIEKFSLIHKQFEQKQAEFNQIITRISTLVGLYKDQIGNETKSLEELNKKNQNLKNKSQKTADYLQTQINYNIRLQQDIKKEKDRLSVLQNLLNTVKDNYKEKSGQQEQ